MVFITAIESLFKVGSIRGSQWKFGKGIPPGNAKRVIHRAQYAAFSIDLTGACKIAESGVAIRKDESALGLGWMVSSAWSPSPDSSCRQ